MNIYIQRYGSAWGEREYRVVSHTGADIAGPYKTCREARAAYPNALQGSGVSNLVWKVSEVKTSE